MKFVESLRKLVDTFTKKQESEIDAIVINNINSRNAIYNKATKEVNELVNSIKKSTKIESAKGGRSFRQTIELKATLEHYYSFVVIVKLKEALEDNGFDCTVKVGQSMYGVLVMININW